MRYDRLLEDKTVWITGGADAPYDAYARLFHAHGARIFMIDACADGKGAGGGMTDSGEGADGGVYAEGTALYADPGVGQCDCVNRFFECDLSDPEGVAELCGDIMNKHGAPDVYLHVADYFKPAYIDDMDYDDLQKTLTISALTPYTVLSRVAPGMAANGGGAAVFVGGHYGVQSMNRVSGYGAAKGAEFALARALAAEYAPFGIRVNAVAPGASFPPAADDVLSRSGYADAPEFWQTVQPICRRGDMSELADAALFLASGMASCVTGEILQVDGAEHLVAHNHNFPGNGYKMP